MIPSDVRTWIEVDTKALKNNYDQFRKILRPSCKLMAVCKSNAYGHDIFQFAKFMVGLGADFLGVDSITEALALRNQSIKTPILVLGYTLPVRYREAAENDIAITISSREQLDRLFEAKDLKLKIHLKIDSGMHRQGFLYDEFESIAETISETEGNFDVRGIYTHFAAAKDPALPSETLEQEKIFDASISMANSYGLAPIAHVAATSATILFPETRHGMVRIGIGLYGLWPSSETKAAFEDKIKLLPALTWKTIISEIKSVKKGERIGYDFTEKLKRDLKIAILPIGYWHGFRRNLSGIGHVIVRNKKARVLGRVSMDMIVVDVTGIDCKVGDEVVLLGEGISAEEMAELADTSWYEIITQITPLIRRVYI